MVLPGLGFEFVIAAEARACGEQRAEKSPRTSQKQSGESSALSPKMGEMPRLFVLVDELRQKNESRF